MSGARRRGEAGLLRGCCLGLVLVVVALAGSAFLADRAIAAPELGAAPLGPDHGDSQAAVATASGMQLTAELTAQPHGVVVLSEHDLTVIAAERNPHPDALHNIAARLRNGQVVVSAEHPVGPFTVIPVARLSLSLDQSGSTPAVRVQLVEVDIGELTVPGFLRDWLAGSLGPSLPIDQIFNSTPALQSVRDNLECIVVAADGVRIGVHRPGTTPDPAVCGS